MTKEEGYFLAETERLPHQARYSFVQNGEQERPDPASQWQPDGVHAASAVVDHSFNWTDSDFRIPELSELVIYELHIGTFSKSGTFQGAIERLPYLAELGVNAVEIMPVAQFPGERNWGYDGAHPYAVQASYGGPSGLKELVNAAHQAGIAVVLDVVYNHLGPEGNYLGSYGPYFTDRYKTPWGLAVNFDGADSDPVREYFIENACYWQREFHIDALRLDAVHAIYDRSPRHILADIAAEVRLRASSPGAPTEEAAWPMKLIAESDLNDTRFIRSQELYGYGLDGQWCDEFHHALHAYLTGERHGYYEDFGEVREIETSLRRAYVYAGEYSVVRRRHFGSDPIGFDASRFVVFTQNHDQVGNRMLGDRLSHLVGPAKARLAAGLMLLSPYVPMLFMGEEYGETAPFLYFVDHSDPALIKGVREGRKREFAAFHGEGEPPDAQAPETFDRSKIEPELRVETGHAELYALYRELIRLRKEMPSLRETAVGSWRVTRAGESLILLARRPSAESVGWPTIIAFNLGEAAVRVDLPAQEDPWMLVLDSASAPGRHGGAGNGEELVDGNSYELQAYAFALFHS
jgi:maltooligosyltrehalose trehalohydrolase